jgi:hypothetical protein
VSARREADLYPPVKAFLEQQGYEVKSEIGHLDVLAIRGDEPPVVVELKTSFNLALLLQGVERQTLFDHVYLAVPASPKGWPARYKDITRLCRRLGLGLLAVNTATAEVEAHLDPFPQAPRKNRVKSARLLREFSRRKGDPNTGGTTGIPRMTAYRQDAITLASELTANGPASPATLARATGIPRAGDILRANVHGWFTRLARGQYALSPSFILAQILPPEASAEPVGAPPEAR